MYEIVKRNPYRMIRFFEHYDDNPDDYLSLLYHPDCVTFQNGLIDLNDNGLERRLEIVHVDEADWQYLVSKGYFDAGNQDPVSKLYCVQYQEDKQNDSWGTKRFIPDQPCPYHELFEEMDAQEEAERKRVFGLLHDSKNFSKRIAARIIDNELHIFYETYNYDRPELCEYYLMDYCRGTYHFSISDTSRFMTLYLTPEEYTQFYGKCNAVVREQYDSLEPLRKMLAEIPKWEYELDAERRNVRQKIQTFRRMQKEIHHMCQKLKLERAYIRSKSYLWVPLPGIEFMVAVSILRYYHAEKEFDCADLDDLDWRAMSVEYYERSKKPAEFRLSDGRCVMLSRKDLYRGYELGLTTIEEIGQFLLKYGKLSIRAYLKQVS